MELAKDRTNEENLHLFKKSVRTLKSRTEPYFLSHAERGKPFWILNSAGGMQNRRHFVPTIFLAEI